MTPQITYEGIKKYLDPSGIEQTLYDPKKDRIIQKEDRTLYIEGLVPKTVYSFNISAKFIDGTWGPPYPMRVETSPDGWWNWPTIGSVNFTAFAY